jgi:probable rRNA maturation factor
VDRAKLTRLVAALDAEARRFRGGCPAGELSLVFLTDRALAKLHADFLDDPSTTDVITFEGDPEHGQAGEICVSADTAAAYAKARRRRLSEELSLYVVHGWLHLAGYDDLRPALKRTLRRAETRAMTLLRRKRLLGAFALTTT